MTGGGLTPAGQWVAVRHGFLPPGPRGDGRLSGEDGGRDRRTLARGELALPEPMGPQRVLSLLNRLEPPEDRSGTCGSWNATAMGLGS